MSSNNSTGRSDTGGGVNNDSRHRRRHQVPIDHQLVAAIRAWNLENLREIILSLHDGQDGRRRIVTENDIDRALLWAAEVGFVDGCRFLWTRLSLNTKQKYFAARNHSARSLLHEAVICGHIQVVRFFIEECNFNINQKNQRGHTPLFCVRNNEEMCRFLLDAGADPNQGGQFGPLYFAVTYNHTHVVRLLLQRGANPNLNRRPSNEEEDEILRLHLRNTDLAIQNGNMEILSLLLQHGAIVDAYNQSLHLLLCHQRHVREIKLSIARFLVEHAKKDHPTGPFMQRSLEMAINNDTETDVCEILLDAGMDPISAMYIAIIQARNVSVCLLLVRQYHVDPFLARRADVENINNGNIAATPFHAASRHIDTCIIFEYFLDLWQERFASNGGKNGDGDYPIHVLCCDRHVSLQAIERVVNRQVDTMSKVDGEQGLLPFHFAATWDTSLDVIYYLLKHCPDALHHVGNAAAVPAVVVGAAAGNGSTFTAVETKNDYEEQQDQDDTLAAAFDPIKKKAKISR